MLGHIFNGMRATCVENDEVARGQDGVNLRQNKSGGLSDEADITDPLLIIKGAMLPSKQHRYDARRF